MDKDYYKHLTNHNISSAKNGQLNFSSKEEQMNIISLNSRTISDRFIPEIVTTSELNFKTEKEALVPRLSETWQFNLRNKEEERHRYAFLNLNVGRDTVRATLKKPQKLKPLNDFLMTS
jgi:hypothetical protein